MNSIGYKEAAALLCERNGFVVFTHANPDGDTIGSAAALVYALRSRGKRAVAFCPDIIPEKLSFLDKNGVFVYEMPQYAETTVAVDIASAAMLGSSSDFPAARPFDLAVDHHKISTLPAHNRLIMPDYIANGEIIYELLPHMQVALDANIAEALYTAICSDSGGFRYSNTRAETYEYGGALLRTGIDFAEINRRLFEESTTVQVALEKAAYNALRLEHGGKLAIVAIGLATLNNIGAGESDFDCIHPIPRKIKGVEVSALIRPKGNGTKVSLRSKRYFDVAEFAKKYGGGGHLHAAGYLFPGTVADATEALIKDMDGRL